MGSVGFEAEMPSDKPADPFRRDALARLGMEDDEPVGDLLQAQRRPAFRSPKIPDYGQNPDCGLALAGLNRGQQTSFVTRERLGVKSPIAVLARLEAQEGMTLCGPFKKQ